MEAVIVLVLLAFAGFFLLSKKQQQARKSSKPSAAASVPLFSKVPLGAAEQSLYWRLVEALPDPEFVVLAQVNVASFVDAKSGKGYIGARNRFNLLSVDFLVCRADFSIVAAVEVDDSTHKRKDRQVTDAKKAAILQAAGVRLIRWPVKPLPTGGEIREAFECRI